MTGVPDYNGITWDDNSPDVPPLPAAGRYALECVNGTAQWVYVSATPATITTISPTSGPTGTKVTLTGTNFTGTKSVMFGAVPATTYTWLSNTSLSVIAPAQADGSVNITFTTASGTSPPTTANLFTYTG